MIILFPSARLLSVDEKRRIRISAYTLLYNISSRKATKRKRKRKFFAKNSFSVKNRSDEEIKHVILFLFKRIYRKRLHSDRKSFSHEIYARSRRIFRKSVFIRFVFVPEYRFRFFACVFGGSAENKRGQNTRRLLFLGKLRSCGAMRISIKNCFVK